MRLKFGLVIFLVLASIHAVAAPQKIKSLSTSAKGQGTITISDPVSGDRKHDVNSVVVTLKENGDAEIVLVAELQLFARGRWKAASDLKKGISLKINGGIVTGNATGSGKLLLRPDAKSIDSLNFDAKGTARSRISVRFVAEKEVS